MAFWAEKGKIVMFANQSSSPVWVKETILVAVPSGDLQVSLVRI